MIKLENVSYKYRRAKSWVLRDFSLEVGEGEFVVLQGKNGSGKSTLARLMAGIVKPKRGIITVGGIDTKSRKDFHSLRKTISIIFQNPENNLLFDRVYDDIAFGLQNLRIPKGEWDGRIKKSLEQVGMNGFEDRSTYELSGGQKQRIAIAGILAMDCKVIVADEVTAMLDTDGKREIYELLWQLNSQGVTIILATNIASEAERGRVIQLNGIDHQEGV